MRGPLPDYSQADVSKFHMGANMYCRICRIRQSWGCITVRSGPPGSVHKLSLEPVQHPRVSFVRTSVQNHCSTGARTSANRSLYPISNFRLSPCVAFCVSLYRRVHFPHGIRIPMCGWGSTFSNMIHRTSIGCFSRHAHARMFMYIYIYYLFFI